MTHADANVTTLSAPGKVLLTGGYLVLDPEFTGLVFALDARIYVQVASTLPSQSVIVVESPQFLEAVWEYNYELADNDSGIRLTQIPSLSSPEPHRNIFIETCLTYTLSYASKVLGQVIRPVSINIFADNAYYTKPALSDSHSKFINLGVPIYKAHKTGLGSSAALVTALSAALLIHYLPHKIDLSSVEGLSYVHNLAQAVHCAAQGKIGSGFDVASAVYGSCIYRRFSLGILISLGEDNTPHFATRLKDVVENSFSSAKWDMRVDTRRAILPAGLRLIMCDVDCGSQTPGMVKRVLAWRHEKPEEANKLWAKLQAKNDVLSEEMLRLQNSKDKDYDRLRSTILEIRSLIRQMSQLSNVPIEPPEQSRLLDACCSVEGVIGGVVPGAGGFDAIVLLIEDRQSVIDHLEELITKFGDDSQVTSKSDTSKITMLRVREDPSGLRQENSQLLKNYLA